MVAPIEMSRALAIATATQNANWHYGPVLSRLETAMQHTWRDRQWEFGLCRVCGSVLLRCTAETPYTVCEDCDPLVAEHYHETETIQTGTPRWDKTCPLLFQRLIRGETRPHYMDDTAMREVVAWTPDWDTAKGLVLVGDSGTGKTLALWTLSRKLEEAGTRMDIYTAVELSRELSSHARDLSAAIHLWKTRVLAIDDLGKERITPAAAALLWELIDRRYQALVPTIITTRFRGQQFADRFTEMALGGDILRRIRDATRAVTFKLATK